jgi:hypothetical protein
VQADVDVRNLVVSGTLVGNIVASESVRLLATARVVGDLASPRVIMDAGAAYRGRVDMGDIEAARAAVASRAVAKPVSSSAAPHSSGQARPAPPRVAPPPKTRRVRQGCAQVRGAPSPAAIDRRNRHPPRRRLFRASRHGVGSAAPAWAKKKIRRT